MNRKEDNYSNRKNFNTGASLLIMHKNLTYFLFNNSVILSNPNTKLTGPNFKLVNPSLESIPLVFLKLIYNFNQIESITL